MSTDIITRWARKHFLGITVAVFTAGTLYAKVTFDMVRLEDNHKELKASHGELQGKVVEQRILLERCLTILEKAYPEQAK